MATTPSPKAISTNVPRYSERNSPQTVVRQVAPAPMRTCQTPIIPLGGSVAVSVTSTSLFEVVKLPEGPLERGGRVAVFACQTPARLRRTSKRHGCSGVTNSLSRFVSSANSWEGAGCTRAAASAWPDVDGVEAPKLVRKLVLAAD